MVRILNWACLGAFWFLMACSGGGEGGGARIPNPGDPHLVQVYVIGDQQNPGSLFLNFLANAVTALPGAKLYVARPTSVAEAQETMREWSARQMDWLVLGGEHTIRAFSETKISWANTKKTLVLGSETPALNDKKVTRLSHSNADFLEWTKAYCLEHSQAPECQASAPQIFSWSHEVSDAPALVEVVWGWPAFFKTLREAGSPGHYRVSFRDGFLTLKVRSAGQRDAERAQRLEAWILKRALAGLSR